MEIPQRETSPSLSYTLFVYREQLQRRKTQYLRLSQQKCILTDELIAKTSNNWMDCSIDDLKVLKRELLFKKELEESIYRMMEQQSLQNSHMETTTTQL